MPESRRRRDGVRWITVAWRAALFALLWWLLAEGRNDGWLLGGIAVVAATWASLVLWPVPARRWQLSALPGFVIFFLVNSIRGGAQVALMALRGRAALKPGCVELTLALPAGAPRVLLTDILALMPGTVGVALDGELLRLHVLHLDMPVAREAAALERRVAALFGVAP